MKNPKLTGVKEKCWAGIDLFGQTLVLRSSKFTVLRATFPLGTHFNWHYLCSPAFSLPFTEAGLWGIMMAGANSAGFWCLFASEVQCNLGQIDSSLYLCILICQMGC